MTQQSPPYSDEGEKGLLGSILLEPERVIDLCLQAKMNVDAFYIPAHKIVFTAIGTIIGKGGAVDIRTVADYLKQKGQIEQAGGVLALDKLIDDTPTSAHAGHYIEMVKRRWLGRKIYQACIEGRSEVLEGDDPEKLRSKLEQIFTDMSEMKTSMTIKEMFVEMTENIRLGMSGAPPERCLSTGYFGLDELNEGGMRKGGVYWLSGEEATGKTSLKCNIINRILAAGKSVASLTLEMTKEDEIERMVGAMIGQSIPRAIRGKGRIDPVKFLEAQKLISESGRFFIEDQSSVDSSTGLWSYARRMVSKHNIDLLVVDYFQLLNLPDSGKMSAEQQIAEKSKCVKDIAGILKIPVLCVAAINKDGKIRYSKSADYDGAGHWRLKRESDARPAAPLFLQEIQLYTQKARFGIPFAELDFRFYGGTGCFEEKGEFEDVDNTRDTRGTRDPSGEND